MTLLQSTIQNIRPLDQEAMAQAEARQNQLTKPPGSLGRLEDLSIQLAGITGQLKPALRHKHVVVMAGDHGVTAEGISAFPAAVTPQMVYNFLNGGAAINVLARHIEANVTVVDVGVAATIDAGHPNFLDRKIAGGTQNIAVGPAMSRQQAQQAVETGIDVVNHLADTTGLDLLVTGDMGIGNTTPSAAIVAAVTGSPVAEVTGRGTGVDDAGLARKIEVVWRAISKNEPFVDGLDILAKLGGFEIGGIAGLILGAAARRVPVLVDGFISTAAALIAAELCPEVKSFMISGHNSTERGHQIMLAYLGLTPLLNLDLRLGEGSGAALSVPIVEAAVEILNEMATFEEAGVSQS
jgi:nicotinate-nucleotide--dimethylbenzimidazole phosphoribosyltransferase